MIHWIDLGPCIYPTPDSQTASLAPTFSLINKLPMSTSQLLWSSCVIIPHTKSTNGKSWEQCLKVSWLAVCELFFICRIGNNFLMRLISLWTFYCACLAICHIWFTPICSGNLTATIHHKFPRKNSMKILKLETSRMDSTALQIQRSKISNIFYNWAFSRSFLVLHRHVTTHDIYRKSFQRRIKSR